MRAFSSICEILVTVVLLFLIPVCFFWYQQELLLQGDVQYQVIYFTDSIRNTGFISAGMYDSFCEKLARTSHSYDIQLSVYKTYWNGGQSEPYCLGTYTEEILDRIYEKGERYTMHQGDFISVSVYRRDSGFVERMLKFMGAGNMSGCEIPIRYGGMVRDECF